MDSGINTKNTETKKFQFLTNILTSKSVRIAALKIMIVYSFFGVLWVIFSDRILQLADFSPETTTWIQTFKGCIYVALTAVIIYFLVKSSLNRQAEIIERRTIGEKLYQRSERYHRIIEFMPGAIFVHSDGKLIFTNMTGAEIMGAKSPNDLIGRSIMEFVHPDFHEIANQRINEMDSEGKSVPPIEERLIRMDGTVIDVEISATALNYGGKKVILSVVHDITHHNQIEFELRQSKKRYRELIEFLPEAVLMIRDAEKVLFANRAAANLLGVTDFHNLIGRSIMDFIPLNRHALTRQRFLKVSSKEGNIPLCEGQIIRADRTVLDIDLTMAPIYYENQPDTLIVMRDITERKRAENLDKLLNEALEYDKLRTDFFTNISHELRTPLNVILSTLQLLSLTLNDQLKDQKGEKISRQLKTMKQNCYRLLRLINNLIDITRADAGFYEIHRQNLNIVSVVEDICLSVADYIKEKGKEFIFDTEIEEKIIACDPDKIERIMLNLLSNAVKFTDAGDRIEVSIYEKNDNIAISVKDTGIGIPEDKQNVIFERFQQVDRLLNRKHEGSGIGLALVKSLVEMHGGRISVQSQEGEGAEFLMELPFVLVPEQDNTYLVNKGIETDHAGKVSIEFSDIYL